MPVPTDEEFSAAIASLEISGDGEMAKAWRYLDLTSERDFLSGEGDQNVRKAFALQDEAWRSVRLSPATAWLANQRSYQRALDSIYWRRKGTPRDEWLDECLSAMKAAALAGDPDALFHTYLGRLCGGFRGEVRRVVMTLQALQEYFYSDEAERIARFSKDAQAHIRHLQKAVAILNHEMPGFEGGRWFTRWSANGKRVASRHADTMQGILRLFENESVSALPPIGRNDATVRERLLVYRLWSMHQRLFRANRVAAIAYLLDCEGIARPLDQRRIERLCEEFARHRSAHRKTPASPGTNH